MNSKLLKCLVLLSNNQLKNVIVVCNKILQERKRVADFN